MRSIIQKLSLFFLAFPLVVSAQTGKGNYSPVSLKDLSSFDNSGSNWSVKGSIAIHPSKTEAAKTQGGEGTLVGNAGAAISTKFKAKDLRLYTEFMLSPGAEGNIVLPGGQRLRLADNKQKEPSALTTGFIRQFPSQNAAKAPGLWQAIELAYDASVSTVKNSARLNSLKLNGVTVLESVYLPLSKSVADAQPISFEVTKGTIAFRNIGYQLLNDRKPLSLNNLTYKLYSDKWDATEYSKLEKEAKTPSLTQEVTNGMREFHLVYEGEMTAEEEGDYVFTTIYSGPILTLDIDGKTVVTSGESTSQESHTGSVSLSKGTHRFKIHYSRFPWRQPALGLRVQKAGIRQYDLHILSSLPEPEPKPYIGVTPDLRPEMVRSFILLSGEKYKRTHCLSVGSPTGWSYTMDLNRGALLQAWRGQFANVTEMWYERGEPQLLEPAGLTVPVSGKSSIAVLDDEKATWPDSANVNYQGYTLDAQGFPAIRYAVGSASVSDHITSTAEGIIRNIEVKGTPSGTLYSLLASGKQIQMIEKGLYQVDDRYYIQIDKKTKVVLRTSGENQELLLPVSGSASYSMFW
ncbi:family 16 glycoside hydrolase [Dyadobacter diqingensis]|uniref:family 16 glycoside hydrolase n=1 Tax=Dyadobacter diqingensis TaxID=2938121 RepID=UPI0020C2F7A9|nr:family 16 glycoside hydrolase [Dyadobacter diqingensis]